MSDVVLYDYPKSSASYRVRIALNLAGIEYKIETVNLLQAQHKSDEHLHRNPQGLVPVLEIDGQSFTQPLAIIEYLDTTRNLNLISKDPCFAKGIVKVNWVECLVQQSQVGGHGHPLHCFQNSFESIRLVVMIYVQSQYFTVCSILT